MARSASVSAPRVDRRGDIVRAAYRLIAERGLEGLRFADIARAAGINNGTLLYYFAGKDALIEAVGKFLVDQYSQGGAPHSGNRASNALDELRWEFTDAAARLNDDAGAVYTELLARAQRDPAVAALLLDIDASWRGWLVSILERGLAQGLFRDNLDTELLATTIMASIRGAGMQAMVMRDEAAAASAMEAIAGLIEHWIVRVS
ncbi:MAG: TetR/AcrR family transcriptional regulator [Chloroflexota bacterium]|nr:TetR/AcrR family transcriptional regulator [Chloroflexota bacterium]